MPTIFDAALLDTFLADFGVPCSANGSAFVGILDTPDQDYSVSSAGIISTDYQLTVRSDVLRTLYLGHGSAITVDGIAYTVRETLLIDDGGMSHVNLTRN